jgi:zinc/manganese transport system substrate-binding protein
MRAVLSLIVAGVVLAMTACGGGGAGADRGSNPASSGRPHVVVTTSMLGDIVRNVVGDQADVDVIMPIGADPHEFSPSTRQAEAMQGADLLVVNGAGLEQSMKGVVDGAGRVFTFADHVSLRTSDGGVDPHLWNDPHAVAGAVDALGAAVAELTGVDAATVRQQAAAYHATLDALDTEISKTLAPIPAARRKLVTNHDSFGYFAARYDLQVIGAVIPSLTTSAASSAADLERLADVVRREQVPAVFAETTQPTKLADALAAEVGGHVDVVELYTESLGAPGSGADSYVGMLRADAQRIAGALS